jgi:hypothetical protein
MIVLHNVFQAKYGKGAELVALFKEFRQVWPQKYGFRFRVLTDVSGPFFTVVTEAELPSLAEWEKRNAEIFSDPDFPKWFARMEPLVESGHREFYNVVE